MTRLLLSTIVQHAAVGVLTVSLARGSYAAAYLAALVVNGTWWINMGHRIDLHGQGWRVGVTYATVAAASAVTGAWLIGGLQ